MKHYWLKMEAIFLALVLIMPGNTLARVYEFEFDNGLKLLVKEDHRAPVVVTQVW